MNKLIPAAIVFGLLLWAHMGVAQAHGPLQLGPATAVNDFAGIDSTGDNDTAPFTATDNNGTWVTIYGSRYNLDGATGTDGDIFASTSHDNGVTWEPAVLVNSTGTSDSLEDFSANISTDGHGVWIASWRSNADYLETGTDQDIQFARSTDNGQTWSVTGVLNSSAFIDGDAFDVRVSTVADGEGVWLATWSSGYHRDGSTGTDEEIVFARSTDGGLSWSDLQF